MLARAKDFVADWFNSKLFLEKLNNPMGYLALITIAIGIGFIIPKIGITGGVMLFALIVGIPALGACLFSPMFGICISLVVGLFIGFITKYVNAPFGMALDALLFVMFFGLLIQQVKERDFSFARSPISFTILIWVFYNLIQVLNPEASSRLAWVFTVRTMAGLILLYFIACSAFNSLARIKFIIKYIIGLALLSALYGLNQEFIGFTSGEEIWLAADEKRYQLIVQWGRIRPFSFFSDPTTFGIFMSYMGTFCWVMAYGPLSWPKRIALIIAGLLMFIVMVFAGSRTPFVLVPFGFVIFTMMTLRKEILIGAGCCLLLFTAAMMKSTSNPVIYRVQSAFSSSSDDTMDVRHQSQVKVRPYIYAHPFGAGLGSTGVWGARFSPDNWLSQIQHDSAFVRVAVELGYIGMLLFAFFLISIVRVATYYYLRVKDPFIKTVYLAITVVIFQLTLASFPQEAIPILPTSLIFYCFLGILVRIKDFDPAFKKEEPVVELISEEENDVVSAQNLNH